MVLPEGTASVAPATNGAPTEYSSTANKARLTMITCLLAAVTNRKQCLARGSLGALTLPPCHSTIRHNASWPDLALLSSSCVISFLMSARLEACSPHASASRLPRLWPPDYREA